MEGNILILNSNISVIHSMVMATSAHHNVPASVAIHDRGARLLFDYFLRASGTSRTDFAHDQDV